MSPHKSSYHYATQGRRLFTYHATSIYGRDPLTLQEGQWVNDTILSFYFEYLTHDILKGDNSILFLAPCLSYFLTHQQNLHELQRALPDNLHTKELIFIPVNNRALGGAGEGGTHWSLLVYVRQSDTYHYFDSLANRNYRCALLTKRNLSQLLSVYLGGAAREPNVVAHSCPQQENDFDCGVFVILFVDLLARRYADLRLPMMSTPPPPPQLPISPQPVSLPPLSLSGAVASPATDTALTHATLPQSEPTCNPLALARVLQQDDMIMRPMSPFARLPVAAASTGGGSGAARFKTFRQDMLRPPVIERVFWWIDYGDLANPNAARKTILDLISDMCRHFHTPPLQTRM